MICQCYATVLDKPFEALHAKGLLSKTIFCYVLDRALYASRCGSSEPFRSNNKHSPKFIGNFCRSSSADDLLKNKAKDGVTKEHVVPGSVLWNLYRNGTPLSVILALYNVAFITTCENRKLDKDFKSDMPDNWKVPKTIDEINNDVVWARYKQTHYGEKTLFEQMKIKANYDEQGWRDKPLLDKVATT